MQKDLLKTKHKTNSVFLTAIHLQLEMMKDLGQRHSVLKFSELHGFI